MKKIFTLALGLIAAASLSAQTVTVVYGEEKEAVENGGTMMTYMVTGEKTVDLTHLGMGEVTVPFWILNPEARITVSENCTLKLVGTVKEAKNDHIPQLCWGYKDYNNPGPFQCVPMPGVGVADVRYGAVEANKEFDPLLDFAGSEGGIFNPNYAEPGPDEYYTVVDVELSNADTNAKLFSYTIIFTSQKGSGVSEVAVDNNNAPREYFDLQGRAVAQPQAGLYIVRQGNKVTKEYIR